MAEEIVNRLKAEGQLIRNTGTNSIRAVRIQLDRFEDIFETISEQVTMQTQFLESMAQISEDQLKINEETREREAERRAREKLAEDKNEESSGGDENGKDSSKSAEDKERKGLFSLLKGMGITKLLMGGSLIAGGLFAGYNILKGFIDEKTDGKFSEFEENFISTINDIDWRAFGDSMKSFMDKLPGALNTFSEFISSPAGQIATALMALGLADNIVGGIVTGAAAGISSTVVSSLVRHPAFLALGAGIAGLYFMFKGSMDTMEKARAFLQGGEEKIWLPGEYEMYETGALEKMDPRRYEEITDQLRSAAEDRQDIISNKAEITDGAYYGGQEYRLLAEDISNINRLIGSNYSIPGPLGNGDEEKVMSQPLVPNEEGIENSRRLGMESRIRENDRQFEADTLGMGPNTTLGGGQWPVIPLEPSKISSVSNRSSKIETAASGGMSPMIINNAPTIAPNVNNVGGSTAVNNTNVVGTGGGSNNIDPYGVPRAAN